MISEKNGEKENLSGHFWELLDKLLKRIWSGYRYYIVNMFYAKIFFYIKSQCEKIVKSCNVQEDLTNK